MELRKHLDSRKVFVAVYFVLFAVYLIIGFQPVDASRFEIKSTFSAPSVGISTDVAELKVSNNRLDTPEMIAGRYSIDENKTLITGHSTTVFRDLFGTKIGDKLYYDGDTYSVTKIQIQEKSAIQMSEILSGEAVPTLVVMTCAGVLYDNGDASHRYMITAVLDS